MLQAKIPTTMISTPNIAKIAAFATLAAMLAMMAFVTMPGAHATLYKKLLVVKILNNSANIHHFKITVKDVANNNKIIYVKNVYIATGNTVVVNAPITISGNSVNVCVQALNALNVVVVQKCKAVSFGDAYIKTVTFAF